MLTNSNRFALLLVAILLFVGTIVQAQTQTDPKAGEHALKLYWAVTSKDTGNVKSLLEADPGLTKRAFLATLEYAESFAGDKTTGTPQASFAFAIDLARLIEDSFKDPAPSKIMALYSAGDPTAGEAFLDYAKEVYPSYTTSPTLSFPKSSVAKLGGFDPQVVVAVRKYTAKWTRILAAVAFSDLKLTLQELNTYPAALDEYRAVMRSHGLATEKFKRTLSEYAVVVEIVKLSAAAELGLFEEFDTRIDDLLAKTTPLDFGVSMSLTGFRLAHRRQDNARSRRYLNSARKAMERSENNANPLFHFVLETDLFRQEQAEGRSYSPEETVQAFKRAWGHLERFEPLTMMVVSASWYEGRYATRFWLDELSGIGEARAATDLMMKDYSRWLEDLNRPEYLASFDNSDPLVVVKVQGHLTLALGILDGALQVLEQSPMEHAEVNFDQFVDTMRLAVDSVDLSLLDIGGSSFPAYDLKSGPYVKELFIRGNYVKALNPKLSSAAKELKLVQVMEEMAELERPEAFIDYHLKLGSQFHALKRGDLAIVCWEKAYEKAQESHFVRRSTEAAGRLAQEFSTQENWTKASFYAKAANHGLQDELGAAEQASGRSFSQRNADLSALAAKAHLESNNPTEALEALTHGHQANTASLQLSSDKEAAKDTRVLQSKKRQVASLNEQVRSLETMPESATRNELLTKTQKVLAQSRSEFLLQSRNIRQKHSRLYTTALRFDPLNLPDIQSALPAETAVLQYFATDEELYLFVVTPKQFRLRSVPIQKEVLEKQILDYLRVLRSADRDNKTTSELSKLLYQSLVKPVEGDIQESTTLVLIPSGKLNILPFGALMAPSGEPFIESKILLELAKTTDFMRIASRQSKPVSTVVAFTNATEDLDAAEAEGEAILALFPQSRIFNREEASKSNFLQYGNGAEVLHLATHGTWDASNSLNNHLKLYNQEKIAQEEIFNLNFDETSIVTLSACSTALADRQDVEYVSSLAEAFWIAGSRTVVASLWPVDDASTGILMKHFYGYLKAGDPKAEALRKAQLELRKNPRFAHPFFWSGFLLFGDYR